jgi:predicted acetyltransferase
MAALNSDLKIFREISMFFYRKYGFSYCTNGAGELKKDSETLTDANCLVNTNTMREL